MGNGKSFYLKAYAFLPEFLRRRINPLDYAIRDFVESAAAGSPSGSLVLDAGAGESRFARLFDGRRYVTLDACVGDPAWDYSKVGVRGDLAAAPFRSGCFDTVVNTQVLEHVEDPATVLSEIHRVLRQNGRLFLTAPQGWHEHQQPNDYFRFTTFSLLKLMREAGFSAVEVRPLGGYFHYLGHRLTYIPKVLFQQRTGVARILLFPLELAALAVFCFLLPIVCYYLDPLDRKKEFTLCYSCLAVKLPQSGSVAP